MALDYLIQPALKGLVATAGDLALGGQMSDSVRVLGMDVPIPVAIGAAVGVSSGFGEVISQKVVRPALNMSSLDAVTASRVALPLATGLAAAAVTFPKAADYKSVAVIAALGAASEVAGEYVYETARPYLKRA